MSSQPVIIGAGAAGLMAALTLAPQPVIVLCAGALGVNAASGWAQGGIAAAIGDDDSPALHVADTIAAGAGLCDAAVVARIIGQGPWAIETLLKYGANFAAGLGLEAAHGRRRIVHAADATGAEVMRVLINAVRATASITVLEHTFATQILTRDGAVIGVAANAPSGPLTLATGNVMIATGGVGGLFAHTTNPLGATGSGLALAARAGAALRDMEFVQFHPTALACGLDPMPLVSEAVRGEGALLVDENFRPFMNGGDLEARDIVARAVAAQWNGGGKAFLDARNMDAAKFPAIFAVCRANGIDPATQPIPVRPAAHYHMGGIAVNADCESNIAGLFACGEAAATGLHGANRLASNSVLEALVTGRIAAETIAGRVAAKPVSFNAPSPVAPMRAAPELRAWCSQHLGILRNADGLRQLLGRLEPQIAQSDAALVAWLIAQAAFRRQESRGGHYRTDYPQTKAALATSFTQKLPTMSLAA